MLSNVASSIYIYIYTHTYFIHHSTSYLLYKSQMQTCGVKRSDSWVGLYEKLSYLRCTSRGFWEVTMRQETDKSATAVAHGTRNPGPFSRLAREVYLEGQRDSISNNPYDPYSNPSYPHHEATSLVPLTLHFGS